MSVVVETNSQTEPAPQNGSTNRRTPTISRRSARPSPFFSIARFDPMYFTGRGPIGLFARVWREQQAVLPVSAAKLSLKVSGLTASTSKRLPHQVPLARHPKGPPTALVVRFAPTGRALLLGVA